MRWTTVILAAAWVVGCRPAASSEGAARSQKKPQVELRLVATSAEGFDREPAVATKLAEIWRRDEPGAIVLSAGGHGPVASQTLRAGGYAAVAVDGDLLRVLDGGVASPRLAANWGTEPGDTLITREGVALQFVGLTAPSAALLGLREAEAELQLAQARLPEQGARGTVAVTTLCFDELKDIVERNRRGWPVLLVVVGQPCGKPFRVEHVFSTLVITAGEGSSRYARVKLRFDRNTGALLKAEGEEVKLAE